MLTLSYLETVSKKKEWESPPSLCLGPFVSLLPISSKVGKAIDILGQGFTGSSAVSFNGTAASFIIKSDTYLTGIVSGWREHWLCHREYARRFADEQQAIQD